MKQVAEYKLINGKKCFASIQEAVSFEGEYHKFANSTYTLPKVQANENQYLVLENEGTENEAWILQEKTLKGTFYEKQGGKIENEIFLRDAQRYTEVPKLEEYEDGTVQTFNEELQVWEYTEKGGTLLEKERIEALEIAKKERLTQLQNDYNASKVIVIQNGETITIKHDTNEREHFWKNIELVSNETTQNHAVLTYRQNDIENNCQYRISLVPFVWQYLFNDLFLFKRSSGFKESIRSKNEGEYTFAKFRITNSQTIEGLNAVSYNFINPQGLIIDISAKATQMLDDINVSQEIKDLIRDRTQNGEIHLIEKFI